MDENQHNRTGTGGGGTSGADLGARALDLGSRLSAGFQQMEPARKKWLAGTAAFLLASVIGLAWYAARPDWRTLYAGLDPEDARQMATELTAAKIPFDVSSDGTTLRVASDDLAKARLAVTAKGGPESGRMGFALFDKPNWIGSEFDEKVNYQRALEGELEQTIDTLSDVESSRVNLVMPHDSLFTDNQRAAKASVVLKLRRHSLSADQAESIRNLVASAVDDLHPADVTLVDADGEQLGPKTGQQRNDQHDQQLASRLIATLEPAAGPGNVRASVNVDYSTASTDEVDETYDPNDVVTLSMQRTEQTAGGAPQVTGVPGTASNAPNTKPPVYPTSKSQTQSEKQESGTYAASKKVLHTTQGPGKVRRITAAVLLNERMVKDGNKITWKPRSPGEMKQLTALAQAAVGYDAARGDTVTVVELPFQQQAATPTPMGQKLLAAVESGPLLKYAVILLALLGLLIFVARPMMAALKPSPAALKAPAGGGALTAASVEPATPEQLAADKQKQHAQLVFDEVAEHLRREPAQSARLLESWIHTE